MATYKMREKMIAIGDDFWIENDAGERAFKVDGKALRFRNTLVLEDASGAELFTVQEKKLHIRDTMEIERDGRSVATVKKALITPLRDRFSIEVDGGPDMEAKGNIVDHEYKIERGADRALNRVLDGEDGLVGEPCFDRRDERGKRRERDEFVAICS